jgi:O-antigen ligase
VDFSPTFVTGIALGILCVLIPMEFVMVLAVIGVMLADTKLVPTEFIYYIRFIPMGVMAMRVLFTKLQQARWTRSSMVRQWFPFLVLAGISVLWSPSQEVSLQRVVSLILVVIGFGYGIPLYLRRQAARGPRLLIMLTGILMVAVGYSFVTRDRSAAMLNVGDYERLHGVFKNPNTLGVIAMVTFFLTFYLLRTVKRPVARYLALGSVLATGVVLLLSGSRGSLAAVVAGITVMNLLEKFKLRLPLSKAVVSLLIVGVVAFLAARASPQIENMLFRRETSGREDLIRRELAMAGQAPWLGVGFGGSDRLYAAQGKGGFGMGSHNSYTKALVELGGVGLVLTLWALYRIVRRALAYLTAFGDPLLGVTLFSGVAAYLVNAFFESWLFGFGSSITIPFWFFLAYLAYLTDEAELRLRMQAMAAGEGRSGTTREG